MADPHAFDTNMKFLSHSILLSVYNGQQEPEGHGISGDTDPDSSDDDCWEFDSERDVEVSEELSKLPLADHKRTQLVKFLDHIAETFAREKSTYAKRHQRRSGGGIKTGRGASHVTASGFVKAANREPRVYIAKNGGVDKKDKQMAQTLTRWICAIAVTAHRPKIDTDRVWTELVRYCKQRLDVYAKRVGSLLPVHLMTAFREGSDGMDPARELHGLAVKYKPTDHDSVETLKRMVSMAYSLRHKPVPDAVSNHGKKARASICFLGRLRAAYEVFKETAIEFQHSFAKLDIICLPAPNSRAPGPSKHQLRRQVEELARNIGLPKPTKPQEQLLKVWTGGSELLIRYHAEVQLLMHFECAMPGDADTFPHLGCSKRSCWLCHQFLSLYTSRSGRNQKGFYQTRGCHGRVYPLWGISLPSGMPQDGGASIGFYLSTTLQDIQSLMRQRLQTLPRVRPAAVPESSANMTVGRGPLHRRALADQRVAEAATDRSDSEHRGMAEGGARADDLTNFVCARNCVRIPADGGAPHFSSIKFYTRPGESYSWTADFSAYWGVSNLDRICRRTEFSDQDPPELDGAYNLYWCQDTTYLPPNRTLMSLLGIESLRLQDYFWHGDVFLTRVQKQDSSESEFPPLHFEDVPRTFLSQKEIFTKIIQDAWDGKEPENHITIRQSLEAMTEKLKSDKEILLGRM